VSQRVLFPNERLEEGGGLLIISHTHTHTYVSGARYSLTCDGYTSHTHTWISITHTITHTKVMGGATQAYWQHALVCVMCVNVCVCDVCIGDGGRDTGILAARIASR